MAEPKNEPRTEPRIKSDQPKKPFEYFSKGTAKVEVGDAAYRFGGGQSDAIILADSEGLPLGGWVTESKGPNTFRVEVPKEIVQKVYQLYLQWEQLQQQRPERPKANEWPSEKKKGFHGDYEVSMKEPEVKKINPELIEKIKTFGEWQKKVLTLEEEIRHDPTKRALFTAFKGGKIEL